MGSAVVYRSSTVQPYACAIRARLASMQAIECCGQAAIPRSAAKLHPALSADDMSVVPASAPQHKQRISCSCIIGSHIPRCQPIADWVRRVTIAVDHHGAGVFSV